MATDTVLIAGRALPESRFGQPQLLWAVAGLNGSLCLVSLTLLVLNREVVVPAPGQPLWLTLLAAVGGPVTGAAVISIIGSAGLAGQPREYRALGWACEALGFTVSFVLFTQEYAVNGLVVAPGALPGAVVAAWAQNIVGDLPPFIIMIALLLFPTGTLALPWWRWVVAAGAVLTGLWILGSLPDPLPISLNVRPEMAPLPVTMPVALRFLAPAVSWAYPIGFWGQVVLVPVGGLSVIWRLRRGRGEQRRHLKWVGLCAAIGGLGLALQVIGSGWPPGSSGSPGQSMTIAGLRMGDQALQAVFVWGSTLWMLGIGFATSIAVAVAVLRYRLYDLDRVLSRTLLVGIMAAFVTAVYAVAVALVGSVVGSAYGLPLAMAASVLVAVTFAPIRSRVRRTVDRLVYGPRATPYHVLATFAERATRTYPNDEVLPAMATALVEATGAASVDVWLRIGSELRVAATAGLPAVSRPGLPCNGGELPSLPGSGWVMPIWHGGELLGALSVSTARGRPLGPMEERLLADLAQQVGLIVQNVRLLEELRSSRERIVRAQLAERHRLERDLHDGAQQNLVRASLDLGVARAMAFTARAGDLEMKLDEVGESMRSCLAELRQIASGLHPRLLEGQGLRGAIAALAERSTVPATVECGLADRYPSAIEATIYYLVAEALTNAMRHARASSVTIRAGDKEGWLRVEISDDGIGGAAPGMGSGLRGLTDRIAALGGRLYLDSPAGVGTTLVAELRVDEP